MNSCEASLRREGEFYWIDPDIRFRSWLRAFSRQCQMRFLVRRRMFLRVRSRDCFLLLLGPKDACGQIGSSPVCCTYDIVNSYAISLGIELKLMVDVELNRLTVLLLSSKQQIDGKWPWCLIDQVDASMPIDSRLVERIHHGVTSSNKPLIGDVTRCDRIPQQCSSSGLGAVRYSGQHPRVRRRCLPICCGSLQSVGRLILSKIHDLRRTSRSRREISKMSREQSFGHRSIPQPTRVTLHVNKRLIIDSNAPHDAHLHGCGYSTLENNGHDDFECVHATLRTRNTMPNLCRSIIIIIVVGRSYQSNDGCEWIFMSTCLSTRHSNMLQPDEQSVCCLRGDC